MKKEMLAFAKEVEAEYFKGLSFKEAYKKIVEAHGLILDDK